MTRFWRFHFPAILWLSLLTVLLLLPGPELPAGEWRWLAVPDYSDKLVHALFFGLAAWLLHRSLGARQPIEANRSQRYRLWLAVALAIGYGGMLEVAQSNPRLHRDCDPWDATANAVGACLYAGGFAMRERLASPDRLADG